MGNKIIDVSEHNGFIDWAAVQKNVNGAILRCGYGDNIASQDDRQFARNLSECERLGIPYGVYLYSYARNEAQAKSELEHILRLIKGHKPDYPVFLDVEENGTQSFAARACEIVCNGLKAAGYNAGVYASLSWWNTHLKNVTAYPRWVAQWATKCTYTGTYLMWQYSETGRVNGITGNVDMNIYYGETAANKSALRPIKEIALEVLAGKWGNGLERKKKLEAAGYVYNDVQRAVNELVKATGKKTVTELAREVIAGKWGNGADRKKRLEAAGYNYAAVQAAVNKLLR